MSSNSSSILGKRGITIVAPSKQQQEFILPTEVNHIRFNPSSSMLATAHGDKTVRLWNASTINAPINTLHGSTDKVLCCQFSQDNNFVLGGSLDKCCRIWSLKTGRIVHTVSSHTEKICAADFTFDSKRICTGSYDKTIKLWDMNKGNLLSTLLCYSSVNALETSSNAEDLCVSGHRDGALRFL